VQYIEMATNSELLRCYVAGSERSIGMATARGIYLSTVKNPCFCWAFLALLLPVLCAQAQNLLDNPGFEQGTNGWVVLAAESMLLTNRIHSGTGAVAILSRTETTDGPAQSLLGKMQPGISYFCSAWARVDSASPEIVRLNFEQQDSAGSQSFTVAQESTNNAWVYLAGIFTLTASGPLQEIRFYIDGPSSGVDLFVDDAVVMPASGFRLAARYAGVQLGGVLSDTTLRNDRTFASVAANDYHIAGAESTLKFTYIEPSSNNFSFTASDAIINSAMTNGQNARGHTLIWDGDLPNWVTGNNWSAAQLQAIIFNHIDHVVSHYKDQLFCWDVVNEAFNSDGTVRSSIWYDRPGIGYAGQGTKYIEEAFKRARAADPDAQLIYNDYNAETLNAKSDGIYAMALDFKTRGVPLDGIGFQMHVGVNGPNISSWRSNLQRFNDLGLNLHITEMDVSLIVDSNGVATATDLATQANTYFNVIGTALGFPRLKVAQTWGFTDKSSWIPFYFPGFGAALPLATNWNRKPAWWAIYDVLANQAEFLNVTDISAGSTQIVVTNSSFSAGRARQLQVNGPGDFLTLAVNVPYSGDYNIRVGVRRNSSSGQFQLAAAPLAGGAFLDIGAVQDTYAATTAYAELNLGNTNFPAAGDYGFRFTVAGKNASSTDYGLALDYIRLTPTGSAGNQAPIITPIADQTIPEDSGTLFVPFTVLDRETVESALTLTATSSNTTLVPAGNLVLLGGGQNRVLSITPVANGSGTTLITLTAADAEGKFATNKFLVTILPSPDPPTVRLSLPLNLAKILPGVGTSLFATASDPDGNLSRVEFYVDGLLFRSIANSPFSTSWTNATPGYHTVSARAVDTTGLSTQSPPVFVIVGGTVSLINTGAVWKYWAQTTFPGNGWPTLAFADAAWPSGPAQLGFGDGDESTLVASNGQWTTYFRRAFQIVDPSFYTNLTMRLLRDDGAVVYLNGAEIWRNNMPANGPILLDTPASSSVDGAEESRWWTNRISPASLVSGTNMLGVEIHQFNLSIPSDLSFDFQLLGDAPAPPVTLGVLAHDAELEMRWPIWAGGLHIESASSLAPPIAWQAVTVTPALSNQIWSLLLPATNTQTFFRLRQ